MNYKTANPLHWRTWWINEGRLMSHTKSSFSELLRRMDLVLTKKQASKNWNAFFEIAHGCEEPYLLVGEKGDYKEGMYETFRGREKKEHKLRWLNMKGRAQENSRVQEIKPNHILQTKMLFGASKSLSGKNKITFRKFKRANTLLSHYFKTSCTSSRQWLLTHEIRKVLKYIHFRFTTAIL
jgi:hypothetical protein